MSLYLIRTVKPLNHSSILLLLLYLGGGVCQRLIAVTYQSLTGIVTAISYWRIYRALKIVNQGLNLTLDKKKPSIINTLKNIVIIATKKMNSPNMIRSSGKLNVPPIDLSPPNDFSHSHQSNLSLPPLNSPPSEIDYLSSCGTPTSLQSPSEFKLEPIVFPGNPEFSRDVAHTISRQAQEAERKVFWKLITIASIFLICLTPLVLSAMYQIFFKVRIGLVIDSISIICITVNSVASPLLFLNLDAR